MHGIFVTGTDTGVGKTVASAVLLARFRPLAAVRYWKPVQTGIEADDDTRTVQELSGAGAEGVAEAGIRLPRPLSPHLSARLAGFDLTIAGILALRPRSADGEAWIVEGAGGVLVPLNQRELMIDLMAHLALPVVVVARSGLGTINHTLLTIEALSSRRLPVAGVIMVGDPNPENRAAIEHVSRVPVVGEIERFPDLSTEAVQDAAARLDPDGRLTRYLSARRH